MTVVETPSFLRRAKGLLSESERADLVTYLAENPDIGKVMEGTGAFARYDGQEKGKARAAATGSSTISTLSTSPCLPC